MNNRYIIAEKVVKGVKIFRRFPKQSWNALKPGSQGLNGWVESKGPEPKPEELAKGFPELQSVTLPMSESPEPIKANLYDLDSLELMTGKELLAIANKLSQRPVQLQAKKRLIEIILENQ